MNIHDTIRYVLKEQRGGHNKLNAEKFIKKAEKKHVDNYGNPKYDYSLVDYVNSDVPVKVICPEHEAEWKEKTGKNYFMVRPSKHLQGQKCKFDYIDSRIKYSDEELENEAKKFKTTSEFKKNSFLHFNSAIKRGNDFFDKITSHFVTEKESTGENLIAKILVEEGLIDENCLNSRKCKNREKTFEECVNNISGKYCRKLRFDFYLPELNTIIEYDGEQHFRASKKFGEDKFKTTQENDKIKNEFCEKKKIKLIRVHYKVPSSEIKERLLSAIKKNDSLTLIGNYGLNLEYLSEQYNMETIPQLIRRQLRIIYEPLGMWRQANNPDQNCETDFGVIGVFPHSKDDEWSILNRFDTNTKVRNRLFEIYNDADLYPSISFNRWIEENRDDIFGPNGRYTEELVNLNLNTIISGNQNEKFAVEKLHQKFPNTKIRRFCSGDIRDTRQGIDIRVEHEERPFNVQVKPFTSVSTGTTESDDGIFYDVNAYVKTKKYSEKNVDVFMFVKYNEDKFILFRNKKDKIEQIADNIIRFYEPPLFTNIENF